MPEIGYQTKHFRGNISIAGTLEVTGAQTFTGAQEIAGALTVGGAFTAEAAAAFEADVDIQKLLTLTPQVVTTAGTQDLAVASTFVSHEGEAGDNPAVTLLTAGHGKGDWFIITNNSAEGDVTITDTGATPGGSTVVLGQNDAATFIFNGTAWVCVSLSDNS